MSILSADPDRWNAVDQYFTEFLVPSDPVLTAALEASEAAGLPAIHVSPNQGKLLQLLVQISDARRVLEIGTLAGYSTIWLARALGPGGRLVTLELDPKHAAVARSNLARAQLGDIVEQRIGPALGSLRQLVEETQATFDFVFIDADKQSTPEYFTETLKLTHPGSIIVVDNVVRNGAVLDPETADAGARGMRRFFEIVQREPRVSATALQTVGSKGYDGFAILRVNPVSKEARL